MTLEDFLTQVAAIAAEKPAYKLGRKGIDGYCDCIGLIIGACERCGLRWKGIHGSNWTARNATDDFRSFAKISDLAVGDLVYKAREPGARFYNLPSRYDGHPDQRDYYHVGVVLSTNPLRIVHCTSPNGIVTDTRRRNWTYHGTLSLINNSAAEPPAVPSTRATLRYGSRGKDVTELQRLLRAEGYSLQPDGIFGSMTREAVRSYQAAHNLTVDGIVGPMTWRALTQGEEV